MTPPAVLYGDLAIDSHLSDDVEKSAVLLRQNAYGHDMDISRLSTPQRISAISILVIAVAAFLPWVSIFGMGVSGIQGDGVITLALAVAGGIVLALTTGVFGHEKIAGKKSQVSLLVMSVLVALIGLMDMNGAAAMGLYLTLFGGVAWVVGAAWQLRVAKNDLNTAVSPSVPH